MKLHVYPLIIVLAAGCTRAPEAPEREKTWTAHERLTVTVIEDAEQPDWVVMNGRQYTNVHIVKLKFVPADCLLVVYERERGTFIDPDGLRTVVVTDRCAVDEIPKCTATNRPPARRTCLSSEVAAALAYFTSIGG